MLNKLTTVLLYDSARGWSPIVGELPAASKLTAFVAMAQDRPSARKLDKGMVISVPVRPSQWHYWLLDEVPPVSELADLLTRLQRLSSGFADVAPEPANTLTAPKVAHVDSGVLQGLANRSKTKGATLSRDVTAKLGLQHLVETGLAERAVLFRTHAGKVRKVWLSDQRLSNLLDQIKLLATARAGTEASAAIVPANTTVADDLEPALLARQSGQESLALILPPAQSSGYGLIAFGAKDEALPALKDLPDLMMVVAPPKPPIGRARRILRWAVPLAAVLALGVWLAQPAPVILNATGVTIAAEATIAALPEDAFLQSVAVRVGDTVEAGDLLATFTSPRLQEAQSEEQLNVSVEQMNAQAALAENKYGAYQLSTQRAEIAQARLDQLREREAGLTLKAPVAGRVIEAIPSAVTGSFLTTGTPVATIQTSSGFLMSLNLSRMDAWLVKTGMTGQVYFRGLSSKAYVIRIVSPAAVVVDPQSGAESVEALAEVTSPDQGQIIVGLSGYARLDGPVEPRISGYGRYISEFIKVRLWTYLGLHF
jgi:Barrel-sandwich domain of CusB or HlyD membrane-fusion